ncbi:FAD-dependent oxidoreductase [Eggerthella sinensis]|uniref:FAD-dependent oxidoreductase n=1 Tax=Eggerthella sinensis TaxID=242230 RepID=UPI001D08489F|nr:FAD-dependent oxidoreductase [Eggerthella sinensis]MCB7038940.1 FAD-dependent oxidoreductase [Eggerthella sinensis]
MSNEKSMTRRGFVGAALAGTMGVAASSFLTGCSAPSASGGQDEKTWTQEADVVVVGAGGAGFAAAIEAANAGASVLLLEKSSAVGGDSTLCDGILGGWGTKLAAAQGIDVTADEVYAWFMGHPEWYGPKDPVVARIEADKSGETIDWLQELGVPFESEVAPRFGYTELPVIHQVEGKGAEMMRVLAETAEKAGVTTLTDTPATKLLLDGDGRVIGVEALQKKETVRFKANKGVVMTTGSFAGSKDMLGTLNAECANLMPGSNPGATGDGIVMAMEAGAYTTRVSELPLMSSLAGVETGSIVNLNYGMRLHGLWLDANGERFFDEETNYENPTGHRAIVRKQNEQGTPPIALLGTTPELDAMQATYPLKWSTAETVEEVAAMVGLDGAKVKATVERYNGFCEAGKDEDFGRPADLLVPMTGPFYAAPIMVSTSVTLGGFKTDENAQALRLVKPANGTTTEPFPGLYAAGVVCEWNCAAGATVLSAMTMGRIAGQNAAAAAPAA